MTTPRPSFDLLTSAFAVALFGVGCGSTYTTTPAPTAPAPAAAAAPAPAPTPVAAAPATPAIPPKVKGENPFKGAHLYSNPYGQAATQAQAWEASGRAADAKALEKIARQPMGWWMGEWGG